MAKLDTYLVEKLREILQRLYAGNKLGNLSQKQSDLEQEQQITHKRSPSMYPYAPTEEMLTDSEVDPVSVKNERVVESSGELDTLSSSESGAEEPYYGSENDLRNSFVSGRVVYNVSSSPSLNSNNSDALTYGIEANCSTTGDSSLNNGSALSTDDVVAKEDDSSALTRNLHEFIHILKMSLNSGAPSFTSSERNRAQQGRFDKSVIPPETYGRSRDEFMMAPSSSITTGSSDPFSGIEAASTTDMEFNITLDDMFYINNLLEGDEPTAGVPLKHILIIVTYFIIACVSIIGNLLVVQLVIRSRRFHTLTHALLANLAAADLFLATFNIPFSAARVILSEWPFGSFLCRTVPFVQVTSVYATSFTMVVIAVDRYQVIMNPLGKRLKCSQGILLVIGIWVVAALLALPYALNHQVVPVLTVRILKRCQAEYGSLYARQLLTVATFLAQYLLPLLFTTVSYVAIMKRLWYRSSGLGSSTPRQVAAQSRAKRKTIKMLVLTVICFALSWAPINFYHLLTQFTDVRPNTTAILICHMIAMSSSMYNPFIFCGLNEHFRREAVKWMHCFRTRRSPVVHPGTEVNGMLTRADVCRRNVSTTVINSTATCRRSPQHQITTISPRACQRRNFANSTTTAVYMSPRRNNTVTSMDRVVVGASPVATRLATNLDSSAGSMNSTSAGYQPELLFLVKNTGSSQEDGNLCTEEEIESRDALNGEDLLETLCDEWHSSIDSKSKVRNLNQSPRDNDEFLSSRESAFEDNDDDDGNEDFSGEVETVH